MDTYDVAIVGAGPGGLACAIKAKEMGLKADIKKESERCLHLFYNSNSPI